MKKALLIIPIRYSIRDVVYQGLDSLEYKILSIDYKPILRKNIFFAKLHTLLMIGRDKFPSTQKKVNNYYKKVYRNFSPDIIFIYNDEMILPSTIELFKETSEVVVILGDNPLTLNPPNRYNVDLLFKANLVVCGDSIWKKQLEKIGLNNIIYDYLAFDPKLYSISSNVYEKKRDKDILFVGRTYGTAWGYKRCLFLNQFADLDIDIFGTGAHWLKWYKMFPKLKKKMVSQTHQKIPFAELKELMLSYKIMPVDANPGIIAGIHLRVFECISAGILPLVEFTEDIDIVFKDIPLPLIRNYSECQEVAKYYLSNDEKRKRVLKVAKKYLEDNYAPKIVLQRILNEL